MAASAEILIGLFGTVGGILEMTVDAYLHVKSFGEISFAMSGYFPEGGSLQDPIYHNLSMAVSAGFSDVRLVDRRRGIIMREDVVFGVTMVAKRKFFTFSNSRKGQMNVFLVLFCFFRVASGTIDIDETFPEMEVRIGMNMAVYARHTALAVNILGPLIGVNEKRSDISTVCDLRDVGFPVAGKAVLVGVGMCL